MNFFFLDQNTYLWIWYCRNDVVSWTRLSAYTYTCSSLQLNARNIMIVGCYCLTCRLSRIHDVTLLRDQYHTGRGRSLNVNHEAACVIDQNRWKETWRAWNMPGRFGRGKACVFQHKLGQYSNINICSLSCNLIIIRFIEISLTTSCIVIIINIVSYIGSWLLVYVCFAMQLKCGHQNRFLQSRNTQISKFIITISMNLICNWVEK